MIQPRLRVFAALSLGSLLLSPALPRAAAAQDEPERDGKWLYQRHCSGCHNDNGDGKGPTIVALGQQARDFKAGGFAFGDSREQIFKTLTSGIPGRSPMPSFAGVMGEEERWLVVDYVRTLMPPRKDEAPKQTVMEVSKRPVIARGKLPPIAEGARQVPRGLLIGDPSGMTFQYDLERVALLGVRLGAFADREDWGDRGGGYLKPLGKLVYQRKDDLVAWPVKLAAADVDLEPFKRIARSTWIRAGVPGISYDVVDAAGVARCRIDETLRVETLSIGAGFTRRWEVRLAEGSQSCSISVADAHEQAWKANPRLVTPGEPPRKPAWWTCAVGEEGVECVLPRSDKPLSVTPSERALVFGVFAKPGERVVLEATLVRVANFTPELGETLAKELGQ
jgi:mono/diheme cytochrome c family protein